MLSIQTVNPDTLELLKAISAQPEIQNMRLVYEKTLHSERFFCAVHWKLPVVRSGELPQISLEDSASVTAF